MSRILIFFLLFSGLLNAQTEYGLNLNGRAGYEYNPFNQASTAFSSKGDAENQNEIRGSFFQRTDLGIFFKTTIKKHQIKAQLKGRADRFLSLREANLLRFEPSISYRYKFNKSSYLKTSLRYISHNTEPLNNATAVFVVPAAYQNINWQSDYAFSPFKNNKTKLSARLAERTFAPVDDLQLSYRTVEARMRSTQKVKSEDNNKGYLGVETAVQQRNYSRGPTDFFFDEEDFDEEELEDFWAEQDELSSERLWRYYTTSLDYTLKRGKILDMTLGLRYQIRQDVWDERFGYQQAEGFFSVQRNRGKFLLKLKNSLALRQFRDLYADQNEEVELQHLFLRSSLLFNYEITESWIFTSEINLRKRWRNQPENSSSAYAPYLTGAAMVGIKYKWNKKV